MRVRESEMSLVREMSRVFVRAHAVRCSASPILNGSGVCAMGVSWMCNGCVMGV